MDLCVVIKGVCFFLQTSIGTAGNCFILMSYISVLFNGSKLMPVDIVLSHLAFVNMMVLLTRGVPQTMTVFGVENVLNDTGCKIVVYSYRIVRALSVSVTCLLSVLQADTISPVPRRSTIKIKDPKHLGITLVIIWVINMAVCIAAPFFSQIPRKENAPKFALNLGFCHVIFPDQLSYILNGFAVSARDFSFVAVMVFASGYIIRTLYRHRKQVQNLRRSTTGSSATAESKAAKDVLRLVLLYVIFFGIDNIIWIYMLTVSDVPPIITDMRVFFSSCYASLSPILIISSNKKIKTAIKCALNRQKITPTEVYVYHI
ncbi:olfactory receptor class A-like protein 1 [Rhinophrynus dorsalis]